MPASTAYFIDINPNLQAYLSKKLVKYGIEGVEIDSEDITTLFTPAFVNDCVIMNLEPQNFTRLLQNRVFKSLRNQPHPKMILLIDEQVIEYIVRHQCGDQVTIFHSNILSDQLVKSIAEIAQSFSYEENSNVFQQVMQGQFKEYPLHMLLSSLKNSGFTGRINAFNDSCEAGEISLKCGQIESVAFQELKGQEALISIAEKTSQFTVDQQIFSEKVLSDFSQHSSALRQLSVRDVLTDIFYFMHEHWQISYSVAEIHQTVVRELNSLESLAREGVYIIYDPQSQEKLHIIGDVTVEHLSKILSFYEALFHRFNDQTVIPKFHDFLKSLDEIQPFVMKFLPSEIVQQDEIAALY